MFKLIYVFYSYKNIYNFVNEYLIQTMIFCSMKDYVLQFFEILNDIIKKKKILV